MEEISTSYDDKTIRKWASDIRKMKIKELNRTIKEHKSRAKHANEYSDPEKHKTIVQLEIDKLQTKLEILKRK